LTGNFRLSALATTCQTLADSGLSARLGAGFVGLALLSACASAPRVAQAPSTGYFVAHAAGDYRPPGPPSDPWGPYIQAAASRFDVPQQWIRQVMQVESGGHEYLDGALIVSSAGAMGLMQLEPETYDEMAARYGLGSDPFNPYDNIMAGTGYIHEMYEVYGSPGFLAAYNAGPGRLDNYMDYHQPLPHETTHYVAMIAPQIQGYYPSHRSEADQLALNTLPASEAPGLLPPGFAPDQPPPNVPGNPIAPAVAVAMLTPPSEPESAVYTAQPVTTPMPLPSPPPQLQQQAPQHSGFALIPSAMADTPSPRSNPSTGTGWGIQVGAYNTASNANAALGIAELSAVSMLMHGQPVVMRVQLASGTKYRARVVDLPHDQAIDACQRLSGGPTGCVVLSPDAQS
jgi:cell division protein FtsN